MEYHPERKRTDRPRVPILLRAWIHRWTRHAPLESLGTGYYQWAATHIARSFLKFGDVLSVFLIGGGLSRCTPGVSDLDFVVVIDPLQEEAFLFQFRKNLESLQRLHPVLGEVHVVRKEAWELFENSRCATRHWFGKRHLFEGEKWKEEKTQFKPQPLVETKVALALLHYWKAHGFLCRSKTEHCDYYLSHFQREVSKAIDYSVGAVLKIRRDQPWERLMATAISRIEECSSAIRFDSLSELPLQVHIKESGGERFGIEIQQRRWLDLIRASKGKIRQVKTTSVPGVMEVPKNLDSGELESLFKDFYSTFWGSTPPPLLLGKASVWSVRCGLGWGASAEHLNWISPSEREEESFLQAVSSLSNVAIRERYHLNATLFRGKLVSASVEKIHKLFEELFFCFHTLSTKTLTNDSEVVRRALRKRFPRLPSLEKQEYLMALQVLEINIDSGS